MAMVPAPHRRREDVRMYTIEARDAVIKVWSARAAHAATKAEVQDAKATYNKAVEELMAESEEAEALKKAKEAHAATRQELQAAVREYDAGPFTSKAAIRVVEATR